MCCLRVVQKVWHVLALEFLCCNRCITVVDEKVSKFLRSRDLDRHEQRFVNRSSVYRSFVLQVSAILTRM